MDAEGSNELTPCPLRKGKVKPLWSKQLLAIFHHIESTQWEKSEWRGPTLRKKEKRESDNSRMPM